ncbi:MAG TPA: two-component system activity regulator YycH [Atopostipes sp.]|nr:two-component system activity regulator YycH [Atopostipes sp.]
MGVSQDKIRNVTLTILVLLSFLLSFNLWTAGRNIGEEPNPNNQPVRSNISNVNHSESIAFRPTLVALHGIDPEQPLMVASTYPLRNLLETRFSTTNLQQLERAEILEENEYLNMLQSDQWVEFIFREEVPIGVFDQKFEELSQENADYFFDRMLVHVDNQDLVYFYHAESRAFYTISVSEDVSVSIDPFLNRDNLVYRSAAIMPLAEGYVYLSHESMAVPYRSYVIDRLPNSLYTSNFFPDTSLVDVRSNGPVTRYIDLTKEVTINDRYHTLVFLRQIQDQGTLNPTNRFLRSFEQVNRFENWAGTFFLSDYDRESQMVSFRREIQGLPVFSTADHETVTEVNLVETGVTHLKLPLRFINTPITMEGSPTEELLPGVEVYNQLSSQLAPADFENIEDLTVGYTWEESDEESQVIYFVPAWYVQYDGNWIALDDILELHGEVAYGF